MKIQLIHTLTYAENVDSVERLRHRIINTFEKMRATALTDN